MNKKKLLSRIMNASGTMRLLQIWQRYSAQPLIVLAYHRVLENWDEHHPGDIELISASLEDFRWQVRYLQKHFNPIGMPDLLDALDGNAELPTRPVILTFDDGFADNAELCAPVLQEYNVPATFFVATELVDTNRMYWFDWVVKAIVTTTRTTYRFADSERCIPVSISERRKHAGELLEDLKALTNDTRHDALQQLAASLDVAPDAARDLDRAMSTSQIRHLPPVIDVASHSHTHPVLTQMPASQIHDELRLSKELISEYTRAPCDAIAYPDGGADAVTREIAASAEKLGYRTGFTYISGVNERTIPRPLLIKRLHIERYVSRHEFVSLLTLPKLFHYPNWPDI